MKLLSYTHFYLVGIKGVAMTALAQCLLDAGKSVRGSDVREQFVTQQILEKCHIAIDEGFENEVPPSTECVIYTAAHGSQKNPQVEEAHKKHLPIFSQAEALADLFNEKKGIAVCGVGGKSTTTAMIVWIFETLGKKPSFAVGVGNIPGLDKTGCWREESEYFIAEADEYVTDPSAPSRGEKVIPRFSFLKPLITVCTNLEFDHPDVYKNFQETCDTFQTFFENIQSGGALIYNAENKDLKKLAHESTQSYNGKSIGFGESADSTVRLLSYNSHEGQATGLFSWDKEYAFRLQIPGKYNAYNLLAAVAACAEAGVPPEQSVTALRTFRSTSRRCEYIGEKNGIEYYDDYAHHPSEISRMIHAMKEWYPNQKLVVGFQSHTFSRTKQLFAEFIDSFSEANEVVMIDIFPSAREAFDPTITSDMLCSEIMKKFPTIQAENLKNIENLIDYCKNKLHPGDVFITLGAGNIYSVHSAL